MEFPIEQELQEKTPSSWLDSLRQRFKNFFTFNSTDRATSDEIAEKMRNIDPKCLEPNTFSRQIHFIKECGRREN